MTRASSRGSAKRKASVLADQQLDAATMVEDELVLTLPFAPRHEGECPGRQ
jgi:uncharacterized metal-binding protein YceD (DUF177 family)